MTNCVFDYGIVDAENQMKVSMKMTYASETGTRRYPEQDLGIIYFAIGK